MADKELMREVGSYPITDLVRVEAGDVDNVNYFVGNIGKSIKKMVYKDANNQLLKVDYFTYEVIGTEADNVKYMFSANVDTFLGGYGLNIAPTKVPNGWYYVTAPITVNGIAYNIFDVIGCYNTNGLGNYKWVKCKLDNDFNLVMV